MRMAIRSDKIGQVVKKLMQEKVTREVIDQKDVERLRLYLKFVFVFHSSYYYFFLVHPS